jgi:polyisoprenoid-binding protein YceI
LFAKLNGRFGSLTGDLTIDEDEPARSSAHASIDVTSIRTGIALRDAHLRSSQFFHVSRFPRMTFRSTRIEQRDASHWEVIGNLTVRDITREVVLETEFRGLLPANDGLRQAGFRASTVLDRRDFGLGLQGPGVIVGDRVDVRLEICATGASTTGRDGPRE